MPRVLIICVVLCGACLKSLAALGEALHMRGLFQKVLLEDGGGFGFNLTCDDSGCEKHS